MPRKGENIYKRKDGRWEGRYIKERKRDGKAVYGYVYARTYREVKEKQGRELARVRNQEVVPKQSHITLQTIVDEWMICVFPKLKESTAAKYRNLVNHYILPKLGKLSLNQLNYHCLDDFYHYLLTEGGVRKQGLSAKTAADTMTLLRRILRFAENHGNTIPCNHYLIQRKHPAKKMRVLSHNEQTSLCAHLLSDLNAANMGILVCLYTGMRIGEICALRWEDVSIRDRTIHVHRTMQRIQTDAGCGTRTKVMITTPKSACSIRMIPLPENLAGLIEEYQTSNTGYFLTGSRNQYMEPRMMQNRFKNVLKQCGIENVNYHVLRHTFLPICG